MTDGKTLQTEPHGSKKAMKKQVDRELRSLIADVAETLIVQYAKKLAADPPVFRRENPPVPEGLGWLFSLGDVSAHVYVQLLRAALPEIDRLIQQYELDQGDAAWWRQWLTKRAAFWAAQHARTAGLYVADHMAGIFSRRYGIPFAHHHGAGAAVFFVPDGKELGEGWRTLRDTTHGTRPEDPNYRRVVYAYHAERQTLLRLHYTRVYLPWGRVVYKWQIDQVWEGMWPGGAEALAWH